jgi:electron transfer flavoprotein-quinone oxidoreductase
MSEDKFSAIIVGAGPAGSTAAYLLAREGLDVLLVEKGTTPGSKNMFGGRMYGHALNRIMPGFEEEAPVERSVTREVITFLSEANSVSLNCQNLNWAQPPHHSFTLLRAEFDAWLASKAEEAGAALACGIRVDQPLMENGRVIGICAGEDDMLADVVIAADGVNSLLAQKAGFARMFSPHQVATGVKQVIELPQETISERFQVEGNNGAVHLFVGDCTKGLQGGGFLYTNRNSVSLGLVIGAEALRDHRIEMSEVVEDFKRNPHVAPLVEGGQVAEYSAHLVPEAGLGMQPQLFGDGMLVAGDAAGFVLNLGYIIRGMDFAIASGAAAAKTVLDAREKNDYSRQGLSRYMHHLGESFVLRDLEAFRGAPSFMENERLYTAYPRLFTELAAEAFTVDGSPPIHMLAKLLHGVRASGIPLRHLATDGWKGARQL